MRLKVRGQAQARLAEGGATSKARFLRPIRPATPDDPKLDPQLQAQIGEQLRSYYVELMREPVPRRFVELVNRLDRKH
jgi:hypothetical protein